MSLAFLTPYPSRLTAFKHTYDPGTTSRLSPTQPLAVVLAGCRSSLIALLQS